MTKIKEAFLKTLRHIENVNKNREVLALKLIDLTEIELARELMYYGLGHDHSKFSIVQFGPIVLGSGSNDDLKNAITTHSRGEHHHPQYWGKIHEMPDYSIAEFSCDVAARSAECGKDVKKWVNEEATKKYEFTDKDKVYGRIIFFLDLLLEKPFKKLE